MDDLSYSFLIYIEQTIHDLNSYSYYGGDMVNFHEIVADALRKKVEGTNLYIPARLRKIA